MRKGGRGPKSARDPKSARGPVARDPEKCSRSRSPKGHFGFWESEHLNLLVDPEKKICTELIAFPVF